MLTFRQITKISTRGVERNYTCVGEELRFSPEHTNKLMVVAHALSVSSETDPDPFYTSFVECRKFFTKNRNDGVIGCSFEKPVFREGEHEGGFCVFVFSGNENKGILMEVDIDELYKEKPMKVINLFGGAGTGKSTLSAELFSFLKKHGYNAEIVPEYAKTLIYEDRKDFLANDQLFVFATQNSRIKTLLEFSKNNPLDFVVVDSPLPLSLIYNYDPFLQDSDAFKELVISVFRQYDNLNVFVLRNPIYGYNPHGRIQKDMGEAEAFDNKIRGLLKENDIPFHDVLNDDSFIENIYGLIQGEK